MENRRSFLTKATLGLAALEASSVASGQVVAGSNELPGTQPLEMLTPGDRAAQMVAGIDRYLSRALVSSVQQRQSFWKRDYSSRAAYENSIAENRQRFRKVIGVVDERVPFESPALDGTLEQSALVASTAEYKIFEIRWPVLRGVEGEGLLFEPVGNPIARVVALPDADWSPEALAGLAPGVPPAAQYARRLAENGCEVLVPVVIDRSDTWSGNPAIGVATNQSHREFIYRGAFEMGRHVIGYEVQKVLAAVDWFSRIKPARPIGVMGYGEGGLLALCSAAADTRIDAVAVSGYFQSREEVWREPVYRNVWALLHEFGDAELAGMVAPRDVVIESSRGPEVPDPPQATGSLRAGRRITAAHGRLTSPPLEQTRNEVDRTRPIFQRLGAAANLSLIASGNGSGDPGSPPALTAFLTALGHKGALRDLGAAPHDERQGFDASVRLHRQFLQLVGFTQALLRTAPEVRRQFWSKADSSSIEKWQQSKEWYRRYLWEEVIGKLPPASEPMSVRARLSYDQPRWRGYDVVIPVWPDVFASGVLLLPKDLKSGERRPVVVCQHGLEGTAGGSVQPNPARVSQQGNAARRPWISELAGRGFVVYAPQNPYIGHEAFRVLMRKGNPLKLSLFSFILGQHERTLDWLTQQPFVDPWRIGFYGISYGGKTAVRVPTLLDKYALSICSADFNEWVWKTVSIDRPFTYPFTIEYDMYEFDFGSTFNYGELAGLMAPRPFMVERGQHDTVSIDEWVAYEYAKVRRFYTTLGIPERTEIEFFDGPHTIHGVGTYHFLHRFLNWPEP
jgi:dienelactone hydrolase